MSYDITIDVRVLSSKNAFIAINSDCIDEAYYYCFFNYMNVVSMNFCAEMLKLNAK